MSVLVAKKACQSYVPEVAVPLAVLLSLKTVRDSGTSTRLEGAACTGPTLAGSERIEA
jgi:hypothetical protein